MICHKKLNLFLIRMNHWQIKYTIYSSTNMLNNPIFTRYLYDFHQVKYSLQKSILDKKREESLFWAYELYHSGFQECVWNLVFRLYTEFYEECNPTFNIHFQKNYSEWQETGDDLLLGTVVGTLSLKNITPNEKKQFVILYKEHRHDTKEVDCNPRYYLKQVSQYPIRIHEEDDCSCRREAYLGVNWLYYCAQTPIWVDRIAESRGKVGDGKVEFETEDDLQEFYERWGLEPDEQCAEMHQWHGVLL